MLGTFRWILLIAFGFLFIVFFIGCAENERREVKLTEERHESEVQPASPGEMVVE